MDSNARRTARLTHHPQARQEIVTRQVWVFTCPECGTDFYLRAAQVQADGSLRCPRCGDGVQSRRWCPGCARTLPYGAFTPDPPRDAFVAEARALTVKGDELTMRCRDCRETPRGQERTCEHCGERFTSARSSSRYCSTAHRVAAHRARSKVGAS